MTTATFHSPCPGCGKPRAIGLSAVARCDACGGEHPVAPDLLRASEAYREARANVPLQLQQAGHIEALSERANKTFTTFRVIAALTAGPLLVLFLHGIHEAGLWGIDETRPRALIAPAYLLPFLVLIAASVLTGIHLARRRAAVDSLLWARPMADVPGQLACRMCSGPLPQSSSSTRRATQTCIYCRTDNIVGSEVSRRAAKLALVAYADHAREVLARVEGRSTKAGVFVALRYAALLPLLVLAVLYPLLDYLASRLEQRRLPFDRAVSYVTAHCPSEDAATIWKTDKIGANTCSHDEEHPIVKPLDPSSLPGKPISCVMWWDNTVSKPAYFSESIRVTGLFADGLGRNLVSISAAPGLRGRCLLEASKVPRIRSTFE